MNPLIRVLRESSDPGNTVENAGVSPSRASAADIGEFDRELAEILWPTGNGQPVNAEDEGAPAPERTSA